MIKSSTSKRQMENQPEVTYQDLLNLTPVPIAIHTKGVLVYANDFAAKLMGAKSPKELLGLPVLRFVHPDYHEVVIKRMKEIYEGRPYTDLISEKLVRLDGSMIDVDIISIRTVFNGETSVLITVRDMTEIMRAQKKLWETNSTLQAIITSSPQPIYFLDRKGIVQVWNKAAERVFGWSESEVIGKILPIAQEEKKEEFHLLMQKLLSGESFSKDLVRQRKDGLLIDVNISATPLYDEKNDQIVSVIAITTDISARKEVERRKDEFLGIASHELKTPVTSIKAYGQVLQKMFKREGNEKAVEKLQKMDAQINKLTNLIGDLLDVTKIQSGKMQFSEEEFDMSQLLSEVVAELQLTTDDHAIELMNNGTVMIFGDRERTGQVITNLISNAIKYSPQAKKIIVRSVVAQDTVTVSVQDFGIGVADEDKEHVFEQFYRVSGPGRETYPGLGLGLYISSEIIKRQGGKIWVESTKGKGSTFYFSLPVSKKS